MIQYISEFVTRVDLCEYVLLFMAIDIITGMLKGFKLHKWNSQKAYPFKKAGTVAYITLCYFIDGILQIDYVGIASCYFAIAIEGLSVLENLSALGIPFPSFITKFFEQMKNKGDSVE